ncbi:tail fiber assembly protein G [Obesumbacterium proteus]|nr:tail fiber assembly protein G [Obesumbacterium proteus]
MKSNKLNEATINISTLQDAVDLDMATDEEIAQLKAWKTYRVLLSRIDTAGAPDIDWPLLPA